MRVKVEGTVDFGQIQKIIHDLYLRAPPGAQMSGVNLYLTLRDAQGRLIEFMDPNGNAIDLVTYTEERRQVPIQNPNTPQSGKADKPKLRVVPAHRAAQERSPDTVKSA